MKKTQDVIEKYGTLRAAKSILPKKSKRVYKTNQEKITTEIRLERLETVQMETVDPI